MAKQYDFEISTRMTVTEPEEFRTELELLGGEVFDRPRKSGYYIEDHRGIGVRSKDQHFKLFERFRYVHFDRVIEPYGAIGLQYMQLQIQLDPSISGEESIGGIDLNCEIAKELHKSIGEYSISGQEFVFNKIDDLPSDRNPDSRVFVLRKQEDSTTIDPLRVVSSFVSRKIEELNPEIHGYGTIDSRMVENGLIIGITSDTNPDRIKTFKDKFTKKYFKINNDTDSESDNIHAQAHEVEVHTKTQL